MGVGTNYTLNLGQLLKMVIKLKKYLWQKMKPNKPQSVTKVITKKKLPFVVPKITRTTIVIDNHVVVIHEQIGKNIVKDVLLDGGFGVNIITKWLRLTLGQPKLKLTPYSLRMVNQTNTKPMGLICNLKIYARNILYITTFLV